ncbi:RNA-directed DNA polymerase from mobile element jockey, partial [Araneus ventricosus]
MKAVSNGPHNFQP